MKNKKGFTLIELLIVMSVIGVFLPFIFDFIEEKEIVEKTSAIVQEFKQVAKKYDVEAAVEEKRIQKNNNIITVIDSVQSYIECFEGKKIIHVNGEIYHIGKMDSWGDIKSINCNSKE